MLVLRPQLELLHILTLSSMTKFDLKNNIKLERAKNNFTQADLALKVGVSRKTINTIETGKFVPSAITAFRIAAAFNLKVEEVFELDEKN